MSNGTGNPWDVDPLICCAARVCCRSAASARKATEKLLAEMGADEQMARKVATGMDRLGVVFMPAKVGEMIRAFREVGQDRVEVEG